MLKHISKRLTIAAAAFALAAVAVPAAVDVAHAARTAPIVQVENEQVPVKVTQTQMESAVIQSLTGKGWILLARAPGRIEAKYARADRKVGEISATIVVSYTASTYSIAYKDSTGLSYDAAKGEIHATYNRWINNLKLDIVRYASNFAMGVAPAQ